MKKQQILLIVTVALIMGSRPHAIAENHILWYEKPASEWKESLPIGNGHLGITVFGGVSTEHLQLSEHSIYRGGRGSKMIDPLRAEHRKRQRELAFAGKEDEALALSLQEFKKSWTGEVPAVVEVEGFPVRTEPPLGKPCEETLGDLKLYFNTDEFSDYRRELDLNTAIATTTYKADGAVYNREVFCSYPDDVMVMRLSCSKNGKLSFNVELDRETDLLKGQPDWAFAVHKVKQGVPRYVDPVVLELFGSDTIRMSGQAAEDGTRFAATVKVLSFGGKQTVKDNQIYVEDADEVLLVFSAATDYYHPESWEQQVLSVVETAAKKPYSELLKTHLDDYQELFGRVELSLGTSDAADLPTDVRYRRIREDAANADMDPGFCALTFDYGRYLLISSSRKGYFPPGIFYWNPDLLAEWHGGHHDDINEQMNYWQADLCNLSELIDPLFDMLDSNEKTGKEAAKYNYGSRGRVVNGITVWGMMWPENSWPGGTGWFAQHYWDHYQYTQDKEFLKKRAYPFMRDAALFYLDYLAVHPETGYLTSYPDMSPENQFIKEDGSFGNVCVGATMTHAIAREVFTHFIAFSEILGVDEDLRAEAAAVLPKITPFKIGKYGQLQEWMRDYDERWPGHRHVSHMYPVYPGNQISPQTTPELAQAAKTSIRRRIAVGDGYGYVGWSQAWMMNICARLEDPKMAYDRARTFVSTCLFPNLFGTHGMGKNRPDAAVRCIDGSFGFTAGIAEMLLQSHLGFVHLLPALPKDKWPEGSIRGLKARGGYEVDVEWKGGELTRAVIHSKTDGICPVRYGDRVVEVPVKAGGTTVLDRTLSVRGN